MDVEQYLRRIEYDGPRQPSPEALRNLHRQHLFTVPFENLDIPLGTPIELDVEGFYDKIVRRRRGGFCYELNGLFAALLVELGFTVHMLSARVRREDGGFGQEFDHMLLKVGLEKPWLADVGFGDSFVDPIEFRDGGADEVNAHRYVVRPMDAEWQLLREDDKGTVALYAFRDAAHELGDYGEMCRYQQTSPESHFTKSWVCSRATPDGRITLANMRLIVTRGEQREERQLRDEADVRSCLRDLFGVELRDSLAKLVEIRR